VSGDGGGRLEVRRAAPAEWEALLAVRHEVFVHEQGVPAEEEVDDLDGVAVHLIALADGEVAGTCRILGGGGQWKVGRMAVRRPFRGLGVGRALMRGAEADVAAHGGGTVRLSAQMHAVGFYSGLGYRSLGGVFPDAGIPHVWMHREIRAEGFRAGDPG